MKSCDNHLVQLWPTEIRYVTRRGSRPSKFASSLFNDKLQIPPACFKDAFPRPVFDRHGWRINFNCNRVEASAPTSKAGETSWRSVLESFFASTLHSIHLTPLSGAIVQRSVSL